MTPEEYELKKREQNFTIFKFIVGTVIIGSLGTWAGIELKRQSLALEIEKHEFNAHDKFLERFIPMTDNRMKLQYAEVMKVLSSGEMSVKYDSLVDYMNRLLTEEKKLENFTFYPEKNISVVEINEVNRLERIISTGKDPETNKTVTEDDYRKAEEKFNEILSKETVKEYSDALDKLETIKTQIVLEPKDSVEAVVEKDVEYFESRWLKEGYLNTHDSLVLAVMKMEAKVGSVSFQLRTGKKIDEGVIRSFDLGAGGVINIPYNGKNISVSLTKIDRAGRNPFNYAAYYDIKITKN